MSDHGSARTWHYRFLTPGGEEIEERELPGDDAADDFARRLPSAADEPIVIQRKGLVEWEYIGEVDARA